VGLGTGGYTENPGGYDHYPECWNENTGCADYVEQAVSDWLASGGRRIDGSYSYYSSATISKVVRASGIPRSEIFFLSKVGPFLPLGYDDAKAQFDQILSIMQFDYVDALLIHWPTEQTTNSTDPACKFGMASYNATTCRLNTWKALVEIYESGKALSIGVSNYNISDIQEIIDAGMPLPTINQCPFHIYHSMLQSDLYQYCVANNITFNGYSPLGVPDVNQYQPPMAPTPLEDPVVIKIAAAHNRTPAQVMLNWQVSLGIPVNPRCQNKTHMVDNLNIFDFSLSHEEAAILWTRPQL